MRGWQRSPRRHRQASRCRSRIWRWATAVAQNMRRTAHRLASRTSSGAARLHPIHGMGTVSPSPRICLPKTEAFVVRELALFLSDGTCFAMANAPSIPHRPPVDGVGTEFETIIPFAVENADSVTVAVDPTGGIPWSMVGQPNGVAGLDETGKVLERHLPELNFDPSGSAAAVQANLTAHTANKNNPHGVTAAQVGAFTKAQTLTAGTAALVGLGADAVPDAVFAKLKNLIDAANTNAGTKLQIYFGSYVGTGTGNVSITAPFPVKLAKYIL